MSTPNYSIYALPAFFVIALAPQAYSTAFINRATNNRFDNANPRGQSSQQVYQKSTDAATWAKYERARAAHSNAMENLPLFFAAVICANMAGLDTGLVNGVCAAFLGLRAAHSVVYVMVADQKVSSLRSMIWMASAGCCLYLMVKAGNVLVDGSGARPMGL